MPRRRPTAPRIVLTLSAALAGAGCSGPEPVAPAASDALPVQALEVESLEGFAVVEAFAGRVVSRRTSDLGFERGGRLDAIRVDEGDRVAAGQELARLEQRSLRARERELAARMAEIRSRLDLARLTRQRRQRLLEQDTISSERYDQSLHEERALAAQLEGARASLEGVRVDLELSTLTAPYPGTITARQVDEGTVVAPGQTLLRLIEDGAMEFRVGLPPATAASLDGALRYAVEVGGRRLPAELDAVVPSVEPDTRTVTAVLRFLEPPEGVGHGALGRLSLETRRTESGFWLPIAALTEGRRGLWSAYAVVDDGAGDRVERRDLQLLHVDSDRAFVRGTLRDGERVVATGLHRLVPGQRVRTVQ